MSYVTQIQLNITLGKDTPIDLIEWFKKCIEHNQFTTYENNPFFKTDRWTQMFVTYGYEDYKKPYIKEVNNGWELFIHTDINYENNELNTFLEWIKPHVFDITENAYIGWYIRDGEYKKVNVYLK